MSWKKIAILSVTLVIYSCSALQGVAKPLRVGIFEDNRAKAVQEIKQTLEDAGFVAGIVKSGRQGDFKEIYDYDVIYFGGGVSAHDWLSREDRIDLVEFVEQRGGGVIFSVFRCGFLGRSSITPLFPEVAEAYNKVNSAGMIVIEPDHPVVKGLPEKFLNPYYDHAVMRLGPNGQALALNTGGEISIACGTAGIGRVVFLGPWIGIDISGTDVYPIPDTNRQLLLNSVQWAGGSGFRKRNGDREPSEQTLLKVLRREMIMQWTDKERGGTRWAGLLTRARNKREQDIDDLQLRVNRYMPIADKTGASGRIMRIQKRTVDLKEELHSNYTQAVENKSLEISRMTLSELQSITKHDLETTIQEWRHRLILPHQLALLAAEVSEIEKELEPELEKYQQQKFAEAREKDIANLHDLVENLKSDTPAVRAEAALELGRIGETGGGFRGPRVESALIAALDDNDYTVRRNSAYALSWMRSTDAVPKLIAMLETSEYRPDRRRAAQALGQIGDSRALPALFKAAENDDDTQVRQNAILAIGWTGDKQAVENLLRIAESALADHAEKRGDRRILDCSIRALGHLGDKQALPFLEKASDIPPLTIQFDRRKQAPVNLVAEAVDQIKAEGRPERGVSQLDVARDKKHFYWMTGYYNALYGRYISWLYQPEDPDLMLRYAEASGGSGTIEFVNQDRWMARRPNIDMHKHFERATSLGLKINTQMPTFPTHPNKALFEREIMEFARHPSFGGMWLEENVSLSGHARSRGDEGLQEYMLSKYTLEELAEIGIEDISQVAIPTPDGPDSGWRIYHHDGARTNKVVFAEFAEMAADFGLDNWRETQEFVAGLRKGTKSSFSMSSRYMSGGSTFISGYPRINLALDAAGPQSYSEHSAVNNFHLDLHVDGESRPAQGEFYAHQSSTPGRVERGFASSFVYGQQFFAHSWVNVFKHSNGFYGEHGRWEAAIRQFNKGRALSEYLAPRATTGARLVTQLFSGRSATLTYGDGRLDGGGGAGKLASQSRPGGLGLRYNQNQEALWESIVRSHLPVEMTWLETQHQSKLANYQVAILADAVSMHSSEVEMIREWVRNGGTLIATASSTLHDQWDRKQENYLLADLFGADYVRTGGNPSLLYVERDMKPETGITEIMITAPEYLGLMEGSIKAEYEKDTGYDVVKPTTGRVVGVWDDGTPAIVENSYGKGNVIFIAARYPALSHATRDWTVRHLYRVYWPGMRELLAACLRRSIELAGAELPMEAENCPETVDVVLKRQDQNNRWMAHLLNMDEKNGVIKDVKLTVTPPHPVQTVYYAYPERQELEFEKTENGIKFMVRPFDVHEMIVIEWE